MTEQKTIKYTIPFDGKTSTYMIWRRKFLSLATLKSINHVLEEDQKDMPKDSDVLDDKTDAAKIKLREANGLAFSMLTLACNDYVSLQQLEAAITRDLKGGNARLAWKNLEKLHKPTNSSD